MVASAVCLNLQLYAQNISVKVDNVTVKQAIETIQKQSDYSFVFAAGDLNTDKVISISSENLPLESVIDQLVAGQNVDYSIVNNEIIIKRSNSQTPQQKVMISGVVTDSSGEPLIGASVTENGNTTNGVVTDLDGRFEFSVNQNSVVSVTYIGYTPQEINVGNGGIINVTLQSDAMALGEVVVTALGIKRSEKALSYNVQQVNADEIVANKDVNFINSLSGKVAGVVVNSSSAGVGGASRVVMRGVKSISQTSNALYVIDGVPIFITARDGGTEFGSQGTTDPIADLNPEDIASMSVLNGAAAAALYGSDAANGAILITTKRGEAGQTSVTVSSGVEVVDAFYLPEFQNRYGTGDLNSPEGSVIRSWGEKLNQYNTYGYDPSSDYFRSGTTFTNNVSFSTGNDKNQTYFSAGSVNSDGIIPNNSYEKYNLTFRNTTSFLDDKMTLNVGMNYIMQNDANMTNQGTYNNPIVGAYIFPRGNDWSDVEMFERYDVQNKVSKQYWPYGDAGMTVQNPYWVNYRNLRDNDRDRYAMDASLSYDVLPWLNLSGRVRVDNSINKYEEKFYGSTNTQLTEQSAYGLYGITTTQDKQTYADALANINKTFGEDWVLTANVGASISDLRSDATKVRGPIRDGIVGGETASLMNVFSVQNLSNSPLTERLQEGWREQTQSVFASAEMGYKGTYFLTVTARNDWPSALWGPNSDTKSFFYPSVGLSGVVSQMVELPKQISYLKVRASYADVGTAFQRYLANPLYSWDRSGLSWSASTRYPAYNLQPENTTSFEVGMTMKFLRHFNMDFTYYNTNTRNQTFMYALSTGSGSKELPVQSGNVKNTGIELAVGFDKQWGKFGWSSNYTLSMNKNEITELGRNVLNPETGEVFDIPELDMNGLNQVHFILREGGSMGDIYSLTDLKRDNTGAVYVDENGNIALETIDNAADYIKLGSVLPDANMAWRNDFRYGNFNLGFMISARLGGVVYSSTQSVLDYYGVSEASAAARDAGGVLINGGDLIDANTWYSSVATGTRTVPQLYTYDATNVRLQELSIGYTFPRKMLGDVCDLNVSLVGRNLFMIYCKAPFDPETTATAGNNYYQGIDHFMNPSLRNIGFNVRVKF